MAVRNAIMNLLRVGWIADFAIGRDLGDHFSLPRIRTKRQKSMSGIRPNQRPASLEALVESGELETIQILHPGGLELTRELAELCRVSQGKSVLDVASGTGESACYLAQSFACRMTGVDHSAFMVGEARRKARDRRLDIRFEEADAHNLPFQADTFDVVLSECTTCALDKQKALGEMARVARLGGWVGISDLYWKEHVSTEIKQRLAEIEEEDPEELAGWTGLFEAAGLEQVQAVDRSEFLARMSKEIRCQLGVAGYVKTIARILRRWGFRGLARVLESQKIFGSEYLGYAIIVGQKREA
jgi:ubiquinone/menaquinone biosynthesis C-methylase UbiE